MFNKVMMVGNLARDPEEINTKADTQMTVMSLAVNRAFKRKGAPEADFFKVLAFGKTAENCLAYLEKGKKVLVEGRIERNPYEDKEGNKRESTEIIAERVVFLSPAGESSKPHREANPYADLTDDDLPF